MPIYQYTASDEAKSCSYCRNGFEISQKLADEPLKTCPKCGLPVSKTYSAPTIGRSRSGFDDRAKAAGFSKLKKLGKGEYERQY